MGGILGDNLSEGNCESKIASRRWGDNICRETSICLAGPSGRYPGRPVILGMDSSGFFRADQGTFSGVSEVGHGHPPFFNSQRITVGNGHSVINSPRIGASQMTTKFLTVKFAKFPNVIESWNFPGKKEAFWTIFSVKCSPPQPPPKRRFY